MDALWQDLRNGVRLLAQRPRLTLAVLACVALGTGATVFIFTLANAVLLRRLPFPDADRLVRIWTVSPKTQARGDLSFLDFQDVRRVARSFDALEMVARTRFSVAGETGTERARGEAVSPGYFGLIGVEPALGRLFTEGEYAPGAPPAILLSDALWSRNYGRRADALGEALRARSTTGEEGDRLFTIVGVMPPGFAGTVDDDVAEFWIPAAQFSPQRMVERRQARNVWVMARLAPGRNLAAAQAEVDGIQRQLAEEHPNAYRDLGLLAEPVGEKWREELRPGLLVLAAAAALLLAVACINVSLLLLARLAERREEIAVRLALGAARTRVLCQLLTESLVLSAAGTLAGGLLAWWGTAVFEASRVLPLPGYVDLSPDGRVLALAVAVTAVTGVLFGVVPAWLGASLQAGRNLREASRGGTPGRRQRQGGRVLMAVEVGFTFVLLAAAALLLRSYSNLRGDDLGFRTENLLRLAVSLDPAQYPDAAAQMEFAGAARESLAAHPGVREVSVVADVLPPWSSWTPDLAVDGVAQPALREIEVHPIDPHFLSVLDVELLRGRNVEAADRADAPPVALVSASLARLLAGGDGSGALGRSFQFVLDRERQRLSAPTAVVGIVEDVRFRGPLAARRVDCDVYLPIEQAPSQVLSFAVHTAVDPATLLEPLKRELGSLAPSSPLHWISTMEEELAGQYRDARLYAHLTAVYGASAALLAFLGIYALLAQFVSRRIVELGIRMAVGAGGSDVVRLVLGEGMATVAGGVAMGAGLAALASPLLGSLLYGMPPNDPGTFAAVGLGVLALGAGACLLPVRRAVRVDPLVALRGEGP